MQQKISKKASFFENFCYNETNYATLAQPAERSIRNAQVMGSSPMGGF